MNCPKCNAPSSVVTPLMTVFNCGTRVWPDSPIDIGARCRINQALAICRRYASPASNPGAHALAGKLVRVLEGAE